MMSERQRQNKSHYCPPGVYVCSSALANVAVNVAYQNVLGLFKHGVNQINVADTSDEITPFYISIDRALCVNTR